MKRALSLTLALTLLLAAVISVGIFANAQLMVRSVANFAELVAAKAEAKNNGGNMEIILTDDIYLDYQLKMIDLNGIVIDGRGHKLIAASTFNVNVLPAVDSDITTGNKDQLVTFTNCEVLLKDITLKTAAMNRHTLNLTNDSVVTLENVTLDHAVAAKGAPLVVNTSIVMVKGVLELVTGENSWYAINLDKKDGVSNPSIDFSEAEEVIYTGAAEELLRLDAPTVSTVVSPENAGLKVDKNGNFVPTSTLDSISIVPIYEILKVGDFLQLVVTRNPVENTTPFTFASSDNNVAMVNDDGLLVAVGEGLAVITVTCGSETATCTVTVKAKVEKEMSVFERVVAFFTMIIQMFIDFFSNIG